MERERGSYRSDTTLFPKEFRPPPPPVCSVGGGTDREGSGTLWEGQSSSGPPRDKSGILMRKNPPLPEVLIGRPSATYEGMKKRTPDPVPEKKIIRSIIRCDQAVIQHRSKTTVNRSHSFSRRNFPRDIPVRICPLKKNRSSIMNDCVSCNRSTTTGKQGNFLTQTALSALFCLTANCHFPCRTRCRYLLPLPQDRQTS